MKRLRKIIKTPTDILLRIYYKDKVIGSSSIFESKKLNFINNY